MKKACWCQSEVGIYVGSYALCGVKAQNMLIWQSHESLMKQTLIRQFGIKELVDLSQFSSARIGGKARYFYEATERLKLTKLLSVLEKSATKYIILGGGSNCIFVDDVYEGLVIRNKMTEISVDGNNIRAESGVTIKAFNQLCKKHGLSGLEMLIGVPGTVGGVVWNNAGAFNMETKDIVTGGKVWYKGQVQEVDKNFFRFGYRHSIFKETRDCILLEAYFMMNPIGVEALEAGMKEILRTRIAREPKGLTCGSFFKNPQNDHAGRLLEAVGAKGWGVGDIKMSKEHANWFINSGTATTKDLVRLRNELKKKVYDKFGVELEQEVEFISNNKQ